MNISFFKIPITFIFLVITLFSCGPTKKDIVYFQNAKDFETVVDTDTFNAKLKVGDIVSIYVSTLDQTVTEPYNLIKSTGSSGGELIDYLIDSEGNIDYPVLGKVKLLGLTVEEAKELFKKKFSDGDLLKDPVIIFRIENYKISVLGAVNRPGNYSITGERITLMEALALAGDIAIKGKRDNILIIRDFNGTKTYTRVDMRNKEVFNSPVYYLTQNDVVYVEPNNSSITSASGNAKVYTFITITSFLITTALIFVTRN